MECRVGRSLTLLCSPYKPVMDQNNMSPIITIVISVSVLYLILFFVRKKQGSKKIPKPATSRPSNRILTSQDIRAISGEDVMATQLDLARAYIEMGKKSLAKQILQHVTQHGNP